MKLPIIVKENDCGDINVFATIEEAEAYMEPVDVENGEYTVTDADDQLLEVRVIIEEIPLFLGFWKRRVEKTRIMGSATGP